MTNGDLAMELPADVGGFEVVRPEMQEGTALGSARRCSLRPPLVCHGTSRGPRRSSTSIRRAARCLRRVQRRRSEVGRGAFGSARWSARACV
jgi:hypothetical protein